MSDYVHVVGSQPPTALHQVPVGAVSPNQRMTVTIKLRSDKLDELNPDKDAPVLTPEEFADQYGIGQDVLDRVQDFAVEHGLTVIEADASRRRVVVSGTAGQFERAFSVHLRHYQFSLGTFRSHAEPVLVPDHLADDVEAVLGLGNHPVAHPHFRFAEQRYNVVNILHSEGAEAGSPVSMSAVDVAELYNFPISKYNGKGTCLGIVELGGGYLPTDMKSYFNGIGLAVPKIVDVSVGGGKNSPGSDADGEVELDIQVAGSIAPKSTIAVYFADNTSQGFVQAITDAAHDSVNKPDAISISWGSAEPTWSGSDMLAMNNAIRDASLLGVSVFVASGDNCSGDGMEDGQAHVDFPASSPWCTACGGTRLTSSGGSRKTETVWNNGPDEGTGGGVSHHYPIPTYQWGFYIPPAANKPSYKGRGVPDISGNADPNSGYEVVIDGELTTVGGTSAVAPLFAGLSLLLVQALGKRLGLLNRKLYSIASSESKGDAFFPLTAGGNNGAYSSTPSDRYNCCVGLGPVNGSNLLKALG